jgi:hypothetical protein
MKRIKIKQLQEIGFEDIITERIFGGMDWDDDVSEFGDYYDTVYRMYNMLLEKGCKEPFWLISDKTTKECAGTGNNMRPIAIGYDVEFNALNIFDLQDVTGLIKEVVINERDYILSRSWIKTWLVVDMGVLGEYDGKYGDYRMLLTDGKYGIITECLTLS